MSTASPHSLRSTRLCKAERVWLKASAYAALGAFVAGVLGWM